MSAPSRLPHGGDRSDAAAHGRVPWLDLSTGINPHAYPAHSPFNAFQSLPQRHSEAALLSAARGAYRLSEATAIVAAPGTQAILQWLPFLIPARTVAVLGPTYQEHAACWSRRATVFPSRALGDTAADLWVMVNPNNPDGRRHDRDEIAAFASALARGRGRPLADAGHPVLIIDEAFMDLTPDDTAAGLPHTLVLRSFGKFYGLAGLRLGFAIGARALTDRIGEALGPWAVSGPALSIGATALADEAWADAMRKRLATERDTLDTHLAATGLRVCGGTDLFRLVETAHAAALQAALAREGVWTRAFSFEPTWLRLGLPGTEGAACAAALARAVTATALTAGPASVNNT